MSIWDFVTGPLAITVVGMLKWAGIVLGAIMAVGLLFAAIPEAYKWMRSVSPAMRIAIIVFVIVPAFFIGLTILIALFSNYAALALRCVFLGFVILIPPGLYYLFIATRRESLLNSYVSNLVRLGLLRHQTWKVADSNVGRIVEAENDRVRRVRGYIERFEALYGKLPDEYVSELAAATREPVNNSPLPEFPKAPVVSSYVDVKTMLPVVSAMALCAIGWVIVLPLNQASLSAPASIQSSTVQSSTKALPPESAAAHPVAPAEKNAPPSGNTKSDDAGEKTNSSATARSWSAALSPEVSPVAFAFVGSYFFSIQMLLRRFVRRDLGPNAYNDMSSRMILSIIGVWVLQEGVIAFGLKDNSEYLYVLAFTIGVFPLIIWQLITESIKRLPFLSIVIPNLTASMPLSNLDGLSVWHQARLEEEDIENIPNLAMADIVDLMLTTRFPPHRIIDWIDQALLRTILPEENGSANAPGLSATLRSYGVRTATTLVAFCTEKGKNVRPALDLLPAADRSRIQTLAAAASIAPNLPLVQTWLGLQTNSFDEVLPKTDVLTALAA